MFWTEGISPMSIMKGSIDGSTEETLLTGLGTAGLRVCITRL